MTTEVKAGSGSAPTPLSTPRESTWEGRLVAEVTPNFTHSPIEGTVRKVVLAFLIPLLLITAFVRFIGGFPNPMRGVKYAVVVIRTPLSHLIGTAPSPLRSALKGGKVSHYIDCAKKLIKHSPHPQKTRDELVRILDETPSAPPKKVSFDPKVQEPKQTKLSPTAQKQREESRQYQQILENAAARGETIAKPAHYGLHLLKEEADVLREGAARLKAFKDKEKATLDTDEEIDLTKPECLFDRSTTYDI